MTKYCKKCNKENADEYQYCLHCGFFLPPTTTNNANSRNNQRNNHYSMVKSRNNQRNYNYSRSISKKQSNFALLLSLLVQEQDKYILEKEIEDL